MKNKLLWLTALILVSVTTIFAQVPTNDLVFQYNLNGNLNETSGNNNGTLAQTGSNLTYIDGIMQQDTNGAAQLNQDQLTNNGNITFTDNVKLFSLSFWFKSATPTTPTTFTLLKLSNPNSTNHLTIDIKKNTAYSTTLEPFLKFTGGSPDNISPSTNAAPFLNNQWHNIVVKTAYWAARNKFYLKVYVDGNFLTEQFVNVFYLNNTRIFDGINLETGTAHNFALDNIRFYNRELSDNEITALYDERNETATQSCTNIVNIPDANFKTALLQHGATITGSGISTIDTDGDGEICQTEAQAYTGVINVNNKNISDLTGIETFTALTGLNCGNNQLTSLNISANTDLTSLYCFNNQLTSLNVSANTALTKLFCYNNKLTSLNVSANTALTILYCRSNQLTSLNVSTNTALLSLQCQNNPDLTCIQHAVGYTPTTYWVKDTTANWSDDCQGTTFWSKATTGVTTNWATASNWTNGLPHPSLVAIIPSGATTYPAITSDVSTNPIGILTIETGASLHIDPSGSLTANTVTNNGTFIITSNATDSGTFEATTVTGNIVYERYATNNWHLVGSPVNGQDIDNFVANANYVLATNATTNAKAFAVYDNTQAQVSDYWQYYQTTTNSGAMVNGKGYAVKRQNTAGAGNLQFVGTYNHGNVTYTGTGSANNKFELVSNPYTRYLDLSNFLTSNTSNMSATNAALYFWNDAQNRYDVYNNASTGNQYVAPGQGFFAEMANTGGSFTFRPNMTTHNATGALLRTAPQTEVLISISEGNSQKTTQIKYLANTGKGLDVGYDAGYFDGHQSNVGIYTKLADGTYNDTNFMLQCVGKDLAEETVIPLGIKTDAARTVTFTAETMNLPDNLKVFLEDTQTGSVTELSNGGSYEATVNAGSGRFFLHTKESARLSTNDVALEGITIFKQENDLQIKGIQESSTVVLHNLQGKKVFTTNVSATQSLVSLPKLATGMYIVTVSNSKGNTSKKIIF